MKKDYGWLSEFTQEELNENLMHVVTGAVDTMEGWVCSYSTDELEIRGLSVAMAYIQDLYDTLHPVIEGCSGEWIFKKY